MVQRLAPAPANQPNNGGPDLSTVTPRTPRRTNAWRQAVVDRAVPDTGLLTVTLEGDAQVGLPGPAMVDGSYLDPLPQPARRQG